MADKETKIFINHIDKFDPWKDAINYTEEDAKRFLDLLANPPEPNEALKALFKDNRFYESGHFYLVPLLDMEPIEVDGNTFNYFKILDANGKKVTAYDYVAIKGDVRLDCENGVFRIYPGFGSNHLVYDFYFHIISSLPSSDELKHEVEK